jgi:tetratricopeptide (TPR) repeat protein
LSRAAAAARAQNFAETLAIVEKVLQEEPENQRGLGLMAEAAQMRALGLIQAQQESEAIPLFFKSAQAIRKLRELNPNLGPTEQRLLPVILYNETCAYCRSAEPDLEKALSSFRDAIDAGFRDVAQIDKDTDLDPIRDQPEFKELRARLEKP